MKLLFSLLFIISYVYAAAKKADPAVGTFPFYLKGPPKVESDVSFVTLEFEIEVTKELNTSDFSSVGSAAFQFTLLPPASLKYVSETTPLALVPSSRTSASSKPFPFTFVRISNDLYKTGFLDSCKFEDAESIFSNLDSEFLKKTGHHTKKSLQTTLSSLKPKETLAVDIKAVKYQTKLRKGTYKWAGKFSRRDDIKTETSISEYYDEFVLALAVGAKGLDDSSSYCITHHEISAALMFKHFETGSKSFIGCRSLDFDYSDADSLQNFHKKLESVGTFEFDAKTNNMDFNFTFTLEDKHNLSFIAGTNVDIVIRFPEFFKNSQPSVSSLCKSKFTPTLAVSSCTFDNETASLKMTVLKSKIIMDTPYSIKINFNKTILRKFLFSKYEFELSIYSKKSTSVSNIPESKLTSALEKAGKNKLSQCVQPVKSLFRESEYYLNNKTHLIAGSKVIVKSDYQLVVGYLYRHSSNMVLSMFIQDNYKLWNKNYNLVIESLNKELKFVRPTEYDINDLDYTANQKPVKFTSDKITINFHGNNGDSMTRDDIYNYLSLYINTENGKMDSIKDENLKFTLTREDGSEILKVIHYVIIDGREIQNIFIQNKETSLYGPYLSYGEKSVKMMFRFKMVGKKNVLAHFAFKKLKGAKSVDGSIEAIFDPNAVVKTKSDGIKSIQLHMDSKIEVEGDKISLIKIEFVVEDPKTFSIGSIDVSVVENPTTTDKFDISKEKTVLLSDSLKFSNIEAYSGNYDPCLSGDTGFSSSRFRSGDNANYFFARLVDCKKPWLRPLTYTKSELIDVSVVPSYSITPTVTLQETLGAGDYGTNKAVKKLMDERRFYEHTLYIYFDETSVYNMNVELEYFVTDKTSSSWLHEDLVTKFAEHILPDTKDHFANVILGFSVVGGLDVYKIIDNKKKIDNKKVIKYTGLEKEIVKFEKFLDLAMANARTDIKGSSFSVIAALESDLSDDLRWNSEYYDTDHKKFSGLKIPVLVDVITEDPLTKYKVQILACDKKYFETNKIKWYNFPVDIE